ncbi:hypothetical protein ACRAWF_23060 [Streptomyces sp. L7]
MTTEYGPVLVPRIRRADGAHDRPSQFEKRDIRPLITGRSMLDSSHAQEPAQRRPRPQR